MSSALCLAKYACGFRSDEEGLLRQTERLAGFRDELHTGFAVGFVRAGDFGMPLPMRVLAMMNCGLPLVAALAFSKVVENFLEIVAVDFVNIPAVGACSRPAVSSLWVTGAIASRVTLLES